MIGRHSYRGVILVLLPSAIVGAIGAFTGWTLLDNVVLLDAAVAFGLSAGILLGIVLTGDARAPLGPAGPLKADAPPTPDALLASEALPAPGAAPAPDAPSGLPVPSAPPAPSAPPVSLRFRARLATAQVQLGEWRRTLTSADIVRIGTGTAGVIAVVLVVRRGSSMASPLSLVAGISAALVLATAGLAATVAQYLAVIEPGGFPEAPALCRGARALAWILVLTAVSIGLAWAGQQTAVHILHVPILLVVAAVSVGLLFATRPRGEMIETFPLDLGVLSLVGSRPNVLASILDSGERQLGIDLRSTWALTVVRRSLEPLIAVLCLLGWLSTALTVVGVDEQALVERLGVPLAGEPLPPGLHVHWPWPMDRVFRVPVQRVQLVHVGHEGEEQGGPEDVLWARQHAANEYTLLLGDGRDLITIDAAVQFRITNLRAWRYGSQNPADALKAVAYRAVMRSTVNLTLSQALSQNVVTLTQQMRSMVQQDADALGLGVDVIGFTVGGMHPPVAVASAYQAVGSAELRKVTAVVNAHIYRNLSVPSAQSEVMKNANAARAQAVTALARATGEAWSFRALADAFRTAREEYMFRRRLEALERGLVGRSFTVIDTRFQRDGGELWMSP
jgi:membrane protease subunit HflK